jgi:ribosomal protein S15P/S13E
MVYLALCENKLIDAIKVIEETKRKYICPDLDCNDNLIYIKPHERNINRINNKSVNITAHFKHHNKNKKSTCNYHCFISSIGNLEALEFYRKWCEPFINESIYNCFNSKSNFHIMYEDIQIITSIKSNPKDVI